MFADVFFFFFFFRFLAFGTGLDPRQAAIFGPQLGPLLVGLSLGVVTASTTGRAAGYGGASVNPARCLAFCVARNSFECMYLDFHFDFPCSKVLILVFMKIIGFGGLGRYVFTKDIAGFHLNPSVPIPSTNEHTDRLPVQYFAPSSTISLLHGIRYQTSLGLDPVMWILKLRWLDWIPT